VPSARLPTGLVERWAAPEGLVGQEAPAQEAPAQAEAGREAADRGVAGREAAGREAAGPLGSRLAAVADLAAVGRGERPGEAQCRQEVGWRSS